jgi:hypothetical protein
MSVNKYRSHTTWFYAQPVIYAFHARLRTPPELTVVARKRYWSGQLTWRTLLGIVKIYHPEQLLIYKSPMGQEWTEFLKSHYVLEYDDEGRALYVSKLVKGDKL